LVYLLPFVIFVAILVYFSHFWFVYMQKNLVTLEPVHIKLSTSYVVLQINFLKRMYVKEYSCLQID
jgi:hypothetical protein